VEARDLMTMPPRCPSALFSYYSSLVPWDIRRLDFWDSQDGRLEERARISVVCVWPFYSWRFVSRNMEVTDAILTITSTMLTRNWQFIVMERHLLRELTRVHTRSLCRPRILRKWMGSPSTSWKALVLKLRTKEHKRIRAIYQRSLEDHFHPTFR
jgi:hypothetical protein